MSGVDDFGAGLLLGLPHSLGMAYQTLTCTMIDDFGYKTQPVFAWNMLGCARYGTHGAIQRLQFIASQAIVRTCKNSMELNWGVERE